MPWSGYQPALMLSNSMAATPDAAKAPEKSYTTNLQPHEEEAFQSWVKQKTIPFDPSPRADYDMRGFWKAMVTGDPQAKTTLSDFDQKPHFPDRWKTPYHKTFSRESMYAPPDAPYWKGDKLYDKTGKLLADETPKKAKAK